MSIAPLYIYFIAFCFLVNIFTYRKNIDRIYLKLFIPFLFITLIIESYSLYLWDLGKTTFKLYNFFTAFEFCFYLFILRLIIDTKNVKTIIAYSLFIYLFISSINILFIQTNGFHSITYSIGCLLIVIFCIYYFFELFRRSTSINLTSEPAFWICSGLLFFYCCSLPLVGAVNFLSQIPLILLNNMQRILNVMNVLLYTLFTIAFLCRLRIPKYTSR